MVRWPSFGCRWWDVPAFTRTDTKKKQKNFLNEKSEKKKIAVGVCGTVFRSFLIFTVISCLLSMVLYQIFVLSAWLTFVFVMFASVSRTDKKNWKKKKIAVGVSGTVFRSFLIFTVISCLVFMVLYQIFVLSAWLTFVFFMFLSVSRTEKKNWKKKKSP